LNIYVKNPAVFQCPSDKGDAYYPTVFNCFQDYGNSYPVQWGIDSWGVQHVDGVLGAPPGLEGASISSKTVALKPATNVIHGDWPWQGNRSDTTPQDLWHDFSGRRGQNMLFGDAQALYYHIPATIDFWGGLAPDINFTWW
jgi:hypothetical protein